MLGANYGGRAINITATTAAHAMSYKITSLYHFPHGHAVAVCLPEIWEYMLSHMDKCIDARGIEYLNGIFDKIARAMGCFNIEQAVSKFRLILSRMEMTKPSSDNRSSDISNLSSSVNPIRLKNNPIALDEAAIIGIYKKIVKQTNKTIAINQG